MGDDADLFVKFGNRAPSLSPFFHNALGRLDAVDLGLRGKPFSHPQGIRSAGRLGWLVLGPDSDDCDNGS